MPPSWILPNQSKQDVNVPQTSEEVEDDTHDGRPRTPIRIKARTYEDGNPSSIQTQKNPDPQSLETVMPMESEHKRTLFRCSGDNEAMRLGRFKLSAKVSADEDVLKEDLVERNKIPEQHCQKDGNPSSIQTQENPDPQFKEEQLLTGIMIPRKSENGNTISNPDPHEAYRKREGKQSSTVSKVEAELPEEYVFKEDLVESPKENLVESCKILKQNYEKLIRIKDEEFRNLRTEKKQNEEKFKVTIERFENQIRNLHTNSDEDVKKTKDENARLKDEIARLEEDVKKTKDENARSKDEIARLEEGMKKAKEMEDENARLKDDKARLEEEHRDLYEAWCIKLIFHINRIKKLEDRIAILEEEYREVYEAGRLAVISEMDETKKEKDENARLKKEHRDQYEAWLIELISDKNIIKKLEDKMAILEEECKYIKNCGICLEEQKQILPLPCHHIYLCQKCFDKCNCECQICRKEITSHVKVFIS